jgi:hypothetical protein
VHGLDGRFEVVARSRPFSLLAPSAATVEVPDGPPDRWVPAPQPAPYVTLTADLSAPGDATLSLASGDVRLTGRYDAASGRTGLEVHDGSSTTAHRSRRWGRSPEPPDALALTLTGAHLTVLTRHADIWTARGRVDLAGRVATRAEGFCAGLRAARTGDAVPAARCGAFGQLGLRDLRFVTTRDGAPVREHGAWLLTATHAGPGFFDTAHTGVWTLDPVSHELSHRSDLFFRRPDRPGVYGDHSTHLVRDGDRWLVATSTWGDFDLSTPAARRRAGVAVTLAETDADLLRGQHVLDTRALPLPTDGLASVAVWDPHLVHDGDRWLVGYVSARKFFRFHPVLAAGPGLDALTLLAADPDRRATEGTTLVRAGAGWRVAASDGRDGGRGQRRAFPVFDLGMRQVGALDAPYPTNLPWPNLAPVDDGWLMVTFDGSRAGGPLLGYGTHGDVLVLRTTGMDPASKGAWTGTGGAG